MIYYQNFTLITNLKCIMSQYICLTSSCNKWLQKSAAIHSYSQIFTVIQDVVMPIYCISRNNKKNKSSLITPKFSYWTNILFQFHSVILLLLYLQEILLTSYQYYCNCYQLIQFSLKDHFCSIGYCLKLLWAFEFYWGLFYPV